MSNAKYVADGFVSDSERLLNDFVQENSTNFTVFATKWKEHNFGLIFSGRDKHELQQFTHEIYQLTLEYLQNTSFILQVGAVYLLYALYRNQLSDPPVKIRIVLQQWEVIKKLKILAEKNCYMHLHYVINFLCANSLDFVAHPILHGPCTSRGRMIVEKPTLHTSYFLKDCKNEMISFQRSNLLKEVQDLSKEYLDLQAKVLPSGDKEIMDGSDLEEYINCLEKIVHDRPYSRKRFRNKSNDINLGNRRAYIKANQFERKALFRQLNPSDSDEDYEPSIPEKEKQVKRYARKRRLPKNQRKIGRPKKYDLEKMLESEGNESDCSLKSKDCIRRRGPLSKSTYLEKYELNIPSSSKMVKNLFSSETSEEESSDTKETIKVEPDALLNNSEDQVDNSLDQVDKSFDQKGNSEDQVDKSFDQKDNSEDQEDDSEDQEDDSDDQESDKDNAINDVSDGGSDEIFELCF